jgi:hypothetical protein
MNVLDYTIDIKKNVVKNPSDQQITMTIRM